MYLNHHYHEQGSSSLTPRTSIGGDGDIPGMPRSGKKKSIFLDTKPSLDKRPSYGGFTTGQNKIGQGSELHPGSKQAFVDDGDEDIVYKTSLPVLRVLRAMGVFPITRELPGMAEFKFLSSAFGYSFGIFVLLMCYVVWVGIHRVKIVQSLEGRFEESVIAYLFLVNILPVIIVPMIWSETGKFANVLNDWNDFEVLYIKVSGRPLPLHTQTKALLIAILLPIMASISVIVTHVTMVDFKVLQVIPYCILDNLTYMMGAYWYLACDSLSRTANILAEDFQMALRHIGPAAMVADYRALWLRLSKLTRDTGTATCNTFTFINLYLFFIITLSIYGLMSQLSEGFGVKDVGLAVTALCNICLLFFICDEAHYASQHVRTNFQKKLLMVELSWMNSDAQTEINMFLRATEMNPSDINCGGFFNVNRNLFKSLLTTMVTYLVVLLQFQISIPEEDVSFHNTTMN